HDGVARAHQNGRVGIDRSPTVLELARETVLHAAKLALARLAEVEIGEQAPGRDRELAHQRLLDLAEPAHEPRQQATWNPVREQKVNVLLLTDFCDGGTDCHETVRLPR